MATIAASFEDRDDVVVIADGLLLSSGEGRTGEAQDQRPEETSLYVGPTSCLPVRAASRRYEHGMRLGTGRGPHGAGCPVTGSPPYGVRRDGKSDSHGAGATSVKP